MKRYYLHISYTGKDNNGAPSFGDALFMISNVSLNEIRERLKNDDELAELPVILSISELSEGLYNSLLGIRNDRPGD